jgi:hypothetical protein
MKKILIFITGFLFIASSCQKKDEATPQTSGSIEIKFDHFVGNQRFSLNQSYTNSATNEQFTPTLLKYFVSNFHFIKEDGSSYVVPVEKSYFLIDVKDNSLQSIRIDSLPAGKYVALEFIIGVDSLMSTKEPEQRPSSLDPAGAAQGMYWSWNPGYIFVKFEGTSPQSPRNGNVFKYHIGGYGGYNTPTINCIRKRRIDFGKRVSINGKDTPSVHLIVDILKFFNGNFSLRIADNPVVMFNPLATSIADNYKEMFKLDHIHE